MNTRGTKRLGVSSRNLLYDKAVILLEDHFTPTHLLSSGLNIVHMQTYSQMHALKKL